jgi:transmembrane sensor
MRVCVESEAIEEAAARWFARRESGKWTDADREAFDAWIASSLAHRIAYIRIDAAWCHAARMEALGAGVPSGNIPQRGSWGDARFSLGGPTKSQSGAISSDSPHDMERADCTVVARSTVGQGGWKVRSRRLGLAAGLLVALTSGLYVYITEPFAGDRFSTSIGGMRTVRLADGSQVTLNTDTRIRVLLGDKERDVDLLKGEAFFEVAKDASHPFIVHAGDKRVMAVGTAFSVRRDSDDVEVVVTEGKVQLATAPSLLSKLEEKTRNSSSRQNGAEPKEATPPVTFLHAGSIGRTAKTEVIVQEQAPSEAEEALSWRFGYVVFRDVTLEQAVAEFNRYNSRKIVIGDPAIGTIRIGGNFHSNNTEAFLALIQSGFPIRVEEGSNGVTLRAR